MPRPPLSVVVATTKAWPEVRACFASLLAQAAEVGAEVILADGSGEGLPERPEFATVVRIHERGASVFRLRALGLAAARGEIVAMTEDHCVVSPGWCAQLLASHRDHAAAAVIGGAVENGARDHVIDWAHFFISNGPFMAPVAAGAGRRVAGQANLSFKRRALPTETPPLGVMEMLYTRELGARGEPLVTDDRLVVAHVQCLGLVGTCASHFHNGRSIAGFRVTRMGAGERLVRLAGCAILPPYMFARTLATIVGKRRFMREGLVSLPFVVLLLLCHTAGEIAGYVAGPGTSPQRLA